MQTFMPYPSFRKSLECLDNSRLGKQRVEARQILHTICGVNKGWENHPAVEMWRGHEQSLIEYYNLSLDVWSERGFVNDVLQRITRTGDTFRCLKPWWSGWPDFHRSHQSNLLRKNQEYYSRFEWEVPNDLPYIWPVDRYDSKWIEFTSKEWRFSNR